MSNEAILKHKIDDGYAPFERQLSALAQFADQMGDHVLAAKAQAALDELQMVMIAGSKRPIQ